MNKQQKQKKVLENQLKKGLQQRQSTYKRIFTFKLFSIVLVLFVIGQFILTVRAATLGIIGLNIRDIVFVNGIILLVLLPLIISQIRFRKQSIALADSMSNELLEKSAEIITLKDEMLSITSHQLKTPITTVLWSVEVLLDNKEKLTEEQRELVESIHTSTSHLNSMINSLLNIARIESGRIAIKTEDTAILDIVETAKNDLQSQLEEKQQTVEVHIDQDMPKIPLDFSLIHHVVMNYMSNASKYSPNETTIRVDASLEDNTIRISVKDNGYGIPEDEQKKLFQKYFRARNAVEQTNNGTGLGLYLIKIIVEIAGGEVGFTSTENNGSTFWFTLPLEGMRDKEGEVRLS